MRCGIRRIPMGPTCQTVGVQPAGCIWEYAWESLALADTATDATIKFVPRAGTARVVGFVVDALQPVQAATGPGAGGYLGSNAVYLTALTSNSVSYLPNLSGSVGAALSNKYSLSAFGRDRLDAAGGVMASLETGEGSPWPQFGIHLIQLSATGGDDVTVTIENQTGLALDAGGAFLVYQEYNSDGSVPQGPAGSVITSVSRGGSSVP